VRSCANLTGTRLGPPPASLVTHGGRVGTGGVAAQVRYEGPPAPAGGRWRPAHDTRHGKCTTAALGVRAWLWATFPASSSSLPVSVFPQNSTSAVISATIPLLLLSGCASREHTHVSHNVVCAAVISVRHKCSGTPCCP